MIKQATQTGVCDKCGADIRSEALFCYHCGAQVASVPVTENGKAAKSVSVADESPKILDNRPTPNNNSSEVLPTENIPTRSNSGQLKNPLPAAATRRKIVKKESEAAKFVWVEKEGGANIWFVIAAIIIAAIAAVVLLAMLYIK